MLLEMAYLPAFWSVQKIRLSAARDDERGMTTETVIITALLAIAAVVIGTLILTSVTNRGSKIQDCVEDGTCATDTPVAP